MIIKIDMDEVICQLTPRWLEKYCELTGEKVSPEDITDWNIFSFVGKPEFFNYLLLSKKMFEELDPVEDAVSSIKYLNEYHDILIVSDAQGDERVILGKINWIKKWIPFIDIQSQVFFTKRKDLIKGDMLIDDGPFIFDSEEYYRVLFDQPHNRGLSYQRFKRVKSWNEILEYIERISEEVKECLK